jgi:hypothetical protein
LGGPGDGSASLEVWRPTSTSGEFQLIVIGPEQAFPTNVVTSHAISIPVLPGDMLGIRSGGDTDFIPTYDSTSSNDVTFLAIGDPVVGQTMGAGTSNFSATTAMTRRINEAVTLTSTDAAGPAPVTPAPTLTTPKKKKCKKKKKRSAESAKKKNCKKRKK